MYAPNQAPIHVSPYGAIPLDETSVLIMSGFTLMESMHLFSAAEAAADPGKGKGASASASDGGAAAGFLPFSQLRSSWPAAEHAVPPSAAPRFSFAFKLLADFAYEFAPGVTGAGLIAQFEGDFPSINRPGGANLAEGCAWNEAYWSGRRSRGPGAEQRADVEEVLEVV